MIIDLVTLALAKGKNGLDGIGISGIEKIKTEGLIDTYRITFTNGENFDYELKNGERGEQGSPGKDGSVEDIDLSDYYKKTEVDNKIKSIDDLIGTTDISSIAPTITAALSIMSGVGYSRNFTDMGLNSLNFDEEYRFNYTLGLSRNFNESLGTYPTDDNWFIMQNYCCTHFAMQIMTTVPNTEAFIKMYVRTKHVDGGWSLWTQLLTSQTTT